MMLAEFIISGSAVESPRASGTVRRAGVQDATTGRFRRGGPADFIAVADELDADIIFLRQSGTRRRDLLRIENGETVAPVAATKAAFDPPGIMQSGRTARS